MIIIAVRIQKCRCESAQNQELQFYHDVMRVAYAIILSFDFLMVNYMQPKFSEVKDLEHYCN